HDVIEFADRDLRLLQCHHAEAGEPVRPARAVFGNAVIGGAMGFFSDVGGDRIVALARWGRDHPQIDAHPGEIGQPAFDRVVHDAADVLVLLRVDVLGGRIGKMSQRDPLDIDMRLRNRGGLRNHHMGVHVDGG
ncbi:hypothetical protein CEE87_13075, partial [Lactobacillus crispatus]